jgi:hypothetical protein
VVNIDNSTTVIDIHTTQFGCENFGPYRSIIRENPSSRARYGNGNVDEEILASSRTRWYLNDNILKQVKGHYLQGVGGKVVETHRGLLIGHDRQQRQTSRLKLHQRSNP